MVPEAPEGKKHSAPKFFDVPELSHVPRLSKGGIHSGNALIHGENLTVLKALLPRFESSVRCCYIDPPYNNGERHYQFHDSREHRHWLEEIVARVEILSEFLREDGSLWISIDDREVHYLKVACDEIFHRKNFVSTVIWEQRTTRENRKVFSNNHEYLLVYAKDIKKFNATRNSLALSVEVKSRYKNPDNDPRGPWQSVSANAQAGHGTADQFYKLISPSGKVHLPPQGRCWIYGLEKMKREMELNNVWFGRDGNGVPRLKRFLSRVRVGLTPETLWLAAEVGTNDHAKKQLIRMFPEEKLFDTPKPEPLIQRVLHIATSPGDLVLDAYLGSGTTAAVAHKLGRHYIGIDELDLALTLSSKRLAYVIDGDPSGISNVVAWNGGGGFDYFRLQSDFRAPASKTLVQPAG